MKTSSIILAVAAVVAVAASFWSGWDIARKRYQNSSERPDTVYRTKWVAAPIPEPQVKPVLPKLVWLPVVEHDTLAVHDTTAIRDSVLVEVPIEERTYPGEDYRVTVRGFHPELVDIWIRQRETTITVPYRKRWSFTVGPQVGVGITPNGWQPYAGAGITFGYSF